MVWPNLDAASLGFNVLPAEAQQGALTTFNTQLVAGRGTAPALPVLLDVSSNADQFGVAIPPASRTGSSLQVQSFVDIGGPQETVGDYKRPIFDIDNQYHTALGPRPDVAALAAAAGCAGTR